MAESPTQVASPDPLGPAAKARRRTVAVAVRELVEFACRRGDLEAEFTGGRRTVAAIRAHQKIQASRQKNYQAEVPVRFQHEACGLVLNIGGRIDGVFTSGNDGQPEAVEEIKTTGRSLEPLLEHEHPVHWGQLKCYAYIVALQNGLGRIGAQLTYCQLDSGEIREIRKTFSLSALTDFFTEVVRCYLDWATVLLNWRESRDVSIRALAFPFSGYRPGQRRMAVAVYRAIRCGEQLLVQAATGIGKTMAALFPAFKALGEGLTAKIFYLTARTTARHAAQKAVAELAGRGLRVKSLTLTAKDKICFQPEAGCSPKECEFARGYYDRLRAALPEVFQRAALDRSGIEAAARRHRLCPFELSLTLALYADCIICDYNYAFDPRVYLRRFFSEENSDCTFLVDEAHNLVDRAREMFSAAIRKKPFLVQRRPFKKRHVRLYRAMGQVSRHLAGVLKKSEGCGAQWSETGAPTELYRRLQRFANLAEDWLVQNEMSPHHRSLLELYFEANAFLRVFETFDHGYAVLYRAIDGDFTVRLFCLDPSAQIGQALNRCRAAVFFSATLSPPAYFLRVFGCGESTKRLVIGSPFPPENTGVFLFDRVSTYFVRRRETAPQIAGILSALALSGPGNYLLFFPSYAYMQMIYDSFRVKHPQVDTILQTPEMDEHQRDAFLKRFAVENRDTLMGFAVMGGVFGEGIDLVGERLSGAVIVGVGLPGISLERDLIRRHFEENLAAGFEFAYMYPGVNRVLQAAGRVIRSERDRGVVLLLDRRFAAMRYRALMPREWQPKIVRNEAQLADCLHRFWEGTAERSGSKL